MIADSAEKERKDSCKLGLVFGLVIILLVIVGIVIVIISGSFYFGDHDTKSNSNSIDNINNNVDHDDSLAAVTNNNYNGHGVSSLGCFNKTIDLINKNGLSFVNNLNNYVINNKDNSKISIKDIDMDLSEITSELTQYLTDKNVNSAVLQNSIINNDGGHGNGAAFTLAVDFLDDKNDIILSGVTFGFDNECRLASMHDYDDDQHRNLLEMNYSCDYTCKVMCWTTQQNYWCNCCTCCSGR